MAAKSLILINKSTFFYYGVTDSGMPYPRYLSTIETLAGILLLIYPSLMFTVKGGMNGAFFLTLLLAIVVGLVPPNGLQKIQWQRQWTAYVMAMFALSMAILINQSVHQDYQPHPYDAASRYFLAIPIFLLLQRLRPRVFIPLQLAFSMAPFVGILMMKDLGGNRYGITTLDLIHYGDFVLLLGVLSLFSLNWFGHDQAWLRILKILGFIAGVGASFMSGSRGGWLAIPVFLAIFLYFKTTPISARQLLVIALSFVFSTILLYIFNSTFYERIYQLHHDITMFLQGNPDTSTGVRWQLYQAAVNIIYEHPLFGVGHYGFAAEMASQVEAGQITPLAAELGRAEVHNDILAKTAAMGIFGFLAILALYLVPFRLFWQASLSTIPAIRRAAILGITFVAGFMVFGLTVELLNLTKAAAFYSFTISVLLAICFNRTLSAK